MSEHRSSETKTRSPKSRAAQALLVAGAAVGLLSSSQAAAEHKPAPEQKAGFAVGVVNFLPSAEAANLPKSEADKAREAIASQYSDCKITEVVDTRTSQLITNPKLASYDIKDQFPQTQLDKVSRDKVTLKIVATRTPGAAAALKRYDQDDTVRWNRTAPTANVVRPNRSTGEPDYAESIPTTYTFHNSEDGRIMQGEISLYPRVDRESATDLPVAIRFGGKTVSVNAETFDHTTSYSAAVCGYVQQQGPDHTWGPVQPSVTDVPPPLVFDPNRGPSSIR